MNRKLCFISVNSLTLCLTAPFLCSFPVQAAAGTLTGSGTASDPYVIEDALDLSEFRNRVNSGDYDAYGILQNNIEVADAWTPIGGNTQNLAFSGHFSGNGHTITLISGQSEETFQGLFACNTGLIENVTISGSISASEYAGGIAAINRGTIEDCSNSASVSVTSSVGFAGGIAGVNYGTIESSSNIGAVSASSSGSCIGGISGAAREGSIRQSQNSGTIILSAANIVSDYNEGCAGGITGLNYAAEIYGSSNSGSVTNNDASGYTGGVTGLNSGTVIHTYNEGYITGTYYSGGIAGYNFLNADAGSAVVRNSLNTGTIEANETGYGAICGANTNGLVYDTYYMEGTANAGIGSSDNNGTTIKTKEALGSGEVTYLLNGCQSSSPIWYQTLTADSYPTLDNTHKVVYRYVQEDGTAVYTNDPSQHTGHEYGEDGECNICHYASVKMAGHSLTLDGAIGINYYYYIDPMYYQNEDYEIYAEFTINGRTETDTFDLDSVLATGDDSMPQVYGFQLYIRSDEMTSPVSAKLIIQKDDQTIVTLPDSSDSFCAYDYLKDLYSDKENNYPQEIIETAQALATLDYYANKYYNHFETYEPEIPLLALDSVDAQLLAPYRQTIEDQSDYNVKHYASTLNLLSETAMSFFIQSSETLDTNTLYMGYKIHGSSDDYTYVQTEKYGQYYRATTERVPASQLNTMWDTAFFTKQDDGSYTQISAIKTAGPLSYCEGTLRTSQKQSMIDLAKAMYLYYQAADTYFQSTQQE